MMNPLPIRKGRLWRQFLTWFARATVDYTRRADVWRGFYAGYQLAKTGSTDGCDQAPAYAQRANPFVLALRLRRRQQEAIDA